MGGPTQPLASLDDGLAAFVAPRVARAPHATSEPLLGRNKGRFDRDGWATLRETVPVACSRIKYRGIFDPPYITPAPACTRILADRRGGGSEGVGTPSEVLAYRANSFCARFGTGCIAQSVDFCLSTSRNDPYDPSLGPTDTVALRCVVRGLPPPFRVSVGSASYAKALVL